MPDNRMAEKAMWLPFTFTGTEGFCFVGVLGPCSATADIITAKTAALGLFGGVGQEEEGKTQKTLSP